MKVLYWPELHLPYIGGAEVHSSHFLPEMRRRGFEFLVLTSHGDRELPDREEIDGVPVVRMHFRGSLEKRDLRALFRVASRVSDIKRAFRPDLIHIHFSGPSTLFHLHSSSASGAPTLVTVHHNVAANTGGAANLGTRILCDAKMVVGVSNAIARHLGQALPELGNRMRVIHNGLELPCREPALLPFDPPVLLALGRLIPEKGVDVALRAFALVKRESPDVEMIVAGDGPERKRLASLATELGLNVAFPGWVEPAEVPALIERATLVLVPSLFAEPFGLVALQASQMARPVVASRRGALPEIVSEGVSGVMFEAGDHTAAASAMMRLLADPEMAGRMGLEGRSRARSEFSIERCADAYEAIYREDGLGDIRGEGKA